MPHVKLQIKYRYSTAEEHKQNFRSWRMERQEPDWTRKEHKEHKEHKERVSTSEYNREARDMSGANNPKSVAAERAKLVPAFESLRGLNPAASWDNALHHAWTLIEAFTALFSLAAAVLKFKAIRKAQHIRELHTAAFPCPSYTGLGTSKAVHAAVKEVLDDMGYGEVAINVSDEANDPEYPSLKVGELV